jgi:hypothetical protein
MLACDDQTASTTNVGDNPAVSTNSLNLLSSSPPLVSEIEQEVLDEYARLLDNVNKVCNATGIFAFCLVYHELQSREGKRRDHCLT